MKSNHARIFLWDEMETLRREDFPLQSPAAMASQVPAKTPDDHHLVARLCQIAMSAHLPEEAAILIFWMFLSFH